MGGMTTIEFNPPEENEWAQNVLNTRTAKDDDIAWALAQFLRSIPKDVGLSWNGVDIRRPHIIRALEDCAARLSHLESEVKRLEEGRPSPKLRQSGWIKFTGGSY